MASTSNAEKNVGNEEIANRNVEIPIITVPNPLTEATVIRLYNSVVVTDRATNGKSNFIPLLPLSSSFAESKSMSSYASVEEGICRICRWNRSDMDVLHCPCQCKGTVGFIHLQCLKRWILLRRSSRCEICNAPFNVPEEKFHFGNMINSFFSARCFGVIFSNILYCTSLVPLSNVILQQVMICMDRLNIAPTEQITLKEVFLGTFALLSSSALFFHYFEFITNRLIYCRHVLRRWWYFGNSAEFIQMEMDVIPSEFQ